MSDYRLFHGDNLRINQIQNLPEFACTFADPPDNIGLGYDTYNDNLPIFDYYTKLKMWIGTYTRLAPISWWSVNYQHEFETEKIIRECPSFHEVRKIIWRFQFGQYRTKDCANGYRPIFRSTKKNALLYPDNILVPSARQTLYNDKRAVGKGRVPDDVWDFPRVAGTHKESRSWQPTQHPEALIERIIKFSTKPGDWVIDPFAGSGTTLRVCQKIDRKCITIEMSENCCTNISKETGIKIEYIT